MPRTLPGERSLVFWLLGLAVASVFLVALSNPVADPDLWGYLAFGRQFWQHGFPYRDIFSYAPVRDVWIYHEWLTGVLFYLIYQWLGFPGIQLVKFLAPALGLLAIYRAAILRGANRSLALATLVLPCLAINTFSSSTRAQILTILLFCLTLLVLEARLHRDKPALLWLLWPINLVWCNLHGGFVVGLALSGIYGLFSGLPLRTKWRDCGVIVGSGLITLVNPYGLDYWRYIVYAISRNRDYIPEWSSVATALGSPVYRGNAWTIILIAVLLVCAYLIARRKNTIEAVTIALFSWAALSHIRNGIFLFLIASAYLPAYITPICAEIGQSLRRSLRRALPAAIALGCLAVLVHNTVKLTRTFSLDVTLDGATTQAPGQPPLYPVAGLRYIEQHKLAGNMLCFYNWGEYLLWKFSPALKVGMDGRYETVYTEAYEQEYIRFVSGTGDWKKAMDDYPVDFVFLPARQTASRLLREDPGWRILYQDKDCVLFERRSRS